MALTYHVHEAIAILRKVTFHSTSVVNENTLHLWGGNQIYLPLAHNNSKKKKVTSTVRIFSLTSGKWSSQHATGTPPLGVMGYTCRAIDDKLYYFGGYCGHHGCYHNSINQLDTTNLKWTELAPTDPDRPVMKRGYGGMITVEWDGVYYLLIIGGKGSLPTTQLPHMEYKEVAYGKWLTNEHSLFSIQTREWSNPIITGQCIPPISGFVLEQSSNNRAILFGGLINNGYPTNAVYILDIPSIDTMCWQSLKTSDPKAGQWPVERYWHAGTIITCGSSSFLAVIGGRLNQKYSLHDCWIFDVTLHSWTQVPLVCERWGHSLTSFAMGPNCVWLMAVGGADDKNEFINEPHIRIIIELIHKNGFWLVGDVLDASTSTEIYKQKYIQRLQLEGIEWEKEEGQKASREEMIEFKEYQNHQMEKEEELQLSRLPLENNKEHLLPRLPLENNKEHLLPRLPLENNKEHLLPHLPLENNEQLQLSYPRLEEENSSYQQLQEKERALEERDQALAEIQYQQSRETVRIQQELLQIQPDHWVIDKGEVIITDEVLGNGSFCSVRVGVFRGLKVAVKSLHSIIISDYNLALFTREMDIASRVRHPNLVHFIGATKVDDFFILTELMTTSLYKELQKPDHLTRPQIISISKDVALGLNCLHQFKPDPIIHRDVSSPNVLLEPSLGGSFKAKVSDYGMASLPRQDSISMPGNQSYAAPEAISPSDHSPSMDVYSYCVLLMEMILHCPPAMTVRERGQQVEDILWPPMKSLVQSGLNNDRRKRPTMFQIFKRLNAF